jgi:hypothetical protein
MQINYQVTTTPPKPSASAPKKSSTPYQIQINWQTGEQEK